MKKKAKKKKARTKAKRKAPKKKSRPRAKAKKKKAKARPKKKAAKAKKSSNRKEAPVAKKKKKSSGKKKRGGKKSYARRASSAVKNIFGRGSASSGPPKSVVMHGAQKLVNGAEGLVAAKGTQMLISKLPVKNPIAKAAIQTGIGFLTGLFFTDKRPWLSGLGDANYYLGMAGLGRSQGLETMAGEEDYHLVVDNEGNVHEMTGSQLEEMQGNLNGNLNGDEDDDSAEAGLGYAMQGNLNGGDDSLEGFDM